MKIIFPILLLIAAAACNHTNTATAGTANKLPGDSLPPPFATKSVKNFSKVIDWPDGQTPVAPSGFTVTLFADDMDHPRWIYVADNGDIFVAESNTILKGFKKLGAKLSRKIRTQNMGESADRITVFRDRNKDGVFESRHVFGENLNQPLGMLVLGKYFYVANTDAVLRFPYFPGDSLLAGPGERILSLPAGGYNNHWTRNLLASKNGDKIYVSVGSGSNVAEHGMENETRRANILEINPDGSDEKIFASGLRNPVGMDWEPVSGKLWTTVNERDELGNDLVPDYITSVKRDGFYGWPFSYLGQHPDPRMKDNPQPELVAKAIMPDILVGAHTASLGLAFYNQKTFPARYHNGVFVAQHGSWNREELSGYKVLFVPFINGNPATKPEDFLTGFVANAEKSEVFGRPVCVAILADGSMLVTDDVSDKIWRVAYNK